MDNLKPQDRRHAMRRVRSTDTTPERVVRRLLHRLGYRYRLHRTDLPGSPDLVFPGRGAVVFVHGCWWHGHRCRRGDRPAASNTVYWTQKLQRNMRRDRRVQRQLRGLGWRVMVVWECQTRADRLAALQRRLMRFLGP